MRLGHRVCLLALAMIALGGCIAEEEPTEEVVVVGSTLPDFEVTMNDGSLVTGAMLRTTPSVVMFFHTACPDCQQTLPRVQRLYDGYVGQGVQFALISREEGEATVAAYWEANGLTMPYSAQEDREVYEKFAYSRVPRIYISNASGRVTHSFTDSPIPTDEDLNGAVSTAIRTLRMVALLKFCAIG